MKPTSKTPFEIRLELLQLAQQILQIQSEAANTPNSVNQTSCRPTTEEIIAEAEKLNAFVSKASVAH